MIINFIRKKKFMLRNLLSSHNFLLFSSLFFQHTEWEWKTHRSIKFFFHQINSRPNCVLTTNRPPIFLWRRSSPIFTIHKTAKIDLCGLITSLKHSLMLRQKKVLLPIFFENNRKLWKYTTIKRFSVYRWYLHTTSKQGLWMGNLAKYMIF